MGLIKVSNSGKWQNEIIDQKVEEIQSEINYASGTIKLILILTKFTIYSYAIFKYIVVSKLSTIFRLIVQINFNPCLVLLEKLQYFD